MTITLALGCIYTAVRMHVYLLTGVLRLPLWFFDQTPIGRILNRFSTDVDVIDTTLPQNLRSWIQQFFGVNPHSLASELFRYVPGFSFSVHYRWNCHRTVLFIRHFVLVDFHGTRHQLYDDWDYKMWKWGDIKATVPLLIICFIVSNKSSFKGWNLSLQTVLKPVALTCRCGWDK